MRKFLCILMILTLTLFGLVGVEYPVKGGGKLSFWGELHGNTAQIVKNQGDTLYSKELEKRTGVTVEYLHPPTGQAKESFGILLAGGNLPDVIEYDWAVNYPGGPTKALDEGHIIKLNDLINKNAPNLKKFLTDNPEINKMVKTDRGEYYVFPMILGGDNLKVTNGLVIREDWLSAYKLKMPETIEEWTNVIATFKEKKELLYPMHMDYVALGEFFGGAFGVYAMSKVYVDNGVVKFGLNNPNLKNYLQQMNKWNNLGFFDKDALILNKLNTKAQDAAILKGNTGISYGSGGSGIGKWMTAKAKEGDKVFSMMGAPCPAPAKGQKSEFGKWANEFETRGNVAITKYCKNPDLAAQWLDYIYGGPGHMLVNFGIEGVSYNMVDGYPKYTAEITDNPKGLGLPQAMSQYNRGATRGAFIQDPRYLEQYYNLRQQQEGAVNWRKTNQKSHELPPVTLTPDESKQVATLMNDINTYNAEMMVKYISGDLSLKKFDTFLAKLKTMGVDKVIKIYQDAYDRFQKR